MIGRIHGVFFATCILNAACGQGMIVLDAPGNSSASSCLVVCSANQHCDEATHSCVCDDACPSAGPICAPTGTNRLGLCVQDPVTGCYSITALARCPSANQTCPVGATACVCPSPAPCTSAERRCKADSSAVEACQADAGGCLGWADVTPCTSHQTCSATGGAGGTPGCVCNNVCASTGVPPSEQCAAPDVPSYQVCTADADTCRYWVDTTCPEGQGCDSAKAAAGTEPACSCPAVPVCTVGTSFRCNANGNPEDCILGAGGCPKWNELDVCNAVFETCVASGAGASCECNPAPGCVLANIGQDFCITDGGTEYRTCAYDASTTCYYFSAVKTCASPQQTCIVSGADNLGSCQCPAPACVIGNASCNVDILDECVADAGGCALATATNCPVTFGAGSTCISAPAPHCQCPAPGPGVYFVDAVNGDSVNGTGATAPPQCALKTITQGLASAADGDSVIVRPGTYDLANGETFPIALKDGVSLTTEATPSSMTEYLIDGTGNLVIGGALGSVDATVVYTGAGSTTLRNFTLTGAPQLFVCIDGTPVLDGVVADGGMWGLSIVDACGPTLTSVTTLNNGLAGTWVATSNGTTAITGGKSDGDAQGVTVNDGTVTVNGLEIGNALGTGVVIRPSDAIGFSRPVALTATGLNIHDSQADGLRLETPFNTGTYDTVTIDNSEFFLNAGSGVRVADASAVFTALSVHDNDSAGIWVDAAASTVDLSASTVEGNQAGGVIVRGGAAALANLVIANNVNGPGIALVTAASGSIDTCDVTGNGGNYLVPGVGASDVGGVVLATPNPISFTGNKVHSNSFNGVDVYLYGQSLGPNACGAGANSFYCYGTHGAGIPNVGVAATSIGAGSVTAEYNVWQNADPSTAQNDFSAGVTAVANACGVNASCP